ncbi:hypothetical protein AGMMS50267_13780 [Spirochaetia bacterium]|nr:hypothetical protein AGMMS50267_13780 [Spirochaetia bacterium]
MRSVCLLSVMLLSICVVVSTCRLDSAVEPLDPNLDTELSAWKAQGVTEYWLTLTHTSGSETYSTKAKVTDDVPQYVEMGGVSAAVLLPEDFPFQPLAETVQGLYDLVAKNTTADTQFDPLNHLPKYVQIGNNTIVVTDFEAVTKKTPIATEDFDWALFNQEKAAWEALNIKSYRFVEHLLCDYPTVPLAITITPNVEPQVVGDETGWYYGDTILEIFTAIESSVKDAQIIHQDRRYSSPVTIRYNPVYHYPEYFFVGAFYDNEPMDGGGAGVEITRFEVLPDGWLETIASKRINFDSVAFNRELRLWEETAWGIKKYTFTQMHESNFVQPPAAVSYLVDVSGSTLLSRESDRGKSFCGDIMVLYSRIASDVEHWKEELYKNADYASLDCDISYNTEWHYPERVRFSIGLTSGGTYTGWWENIDIIEFKKLE